MSTDNNPFHFPNYRKWYFGTTFLEISASIYVATSLLVLSLIKDAATSGIIVGLIGGLGIFCGIFGGVIADTINRKRVLNTLITLAAIANVCIFAVIFFVDVDLDTFPLLVYSVIFLLALESACLHTAAPSQDGSLKSIISPASYPGAMGAAQARESILSVIGNPISGVLYGIHHGFPFGVRAICQTAFLIFFNKIKADLGPSNKTQNMNPERPPSNLLFKLQVFAGYKESFRFLASRPAMLRFIICAPLVNFMVVLYMTWSVFYLRNSGHSAFTVGLAVAGFAVGSLLGSTLNTFLSRRIRPGWLAIYGLGFMTFAFIIFGIFGKSPQTIFIFSTIAMLPSPPLNAGIFTYVFSETTTDMQGRIIATFQTVGGVSAIAGPVVAGLASSGEGTLPLLAACGVSIAGVLSILFSKDVRRIPKI